MQAKYEATKAAKIGAICCITYIVSYAFRNILSVFTPQMLTSSLFTKESIAVLSSVYMIVYAFGQLVNGVLGDYFKPKYMAFIGLCVSGVGLLLFPSMQTNAAQIVCFALLGFGMSMLRGPLVKIISENSLPQYARLSCSLLSVSSSVGPLIASFASIYFQWNAVFVISAVVSFAFAVITLLVLTRFERRGMVVSLTHAREQKNSFDLLAVFRLPHFVRFLFMAMIVEISITSINFWIPTYLSEYLHFDAATSGMFYSGMSLVKSIAPFVCLMLLSLFHENCIRMMRSMFLISAVLLVIIFFIDFPWPNAILFTLSCTTASIASAALWSVYIPSLGQSGRVSTANGVLDCAGYIGGAIANIVFARLITQLGWRATILSWALVFAIGIVVTILPSKTAARSANQ